MRLWRGEMTIEYSGILVRIQFVVQRNCCKSLAWDGLLISSNFSRRRRSKRAPSPSIVRPQKFASRRKNWDFAACTFRPCLRQMAKNSLRLVSNSSSDLAWSKKSSSHCRRRSERVSKSGAVQASKWSPALPVVHVVVSAHQQGFGWTCIPANLGAAGFASRHGEDPPSRISCFPGLDQRLQIWHWRCHWFSHRIRSAQIHSEKDLLRAWLRDRKSWACPPGLRVRVDGPHVL